MRHQTAESTPARRPQPAARAARVLCAAAALLGGFAPAALAQQSVTIQRDNEALVADPGGTRLGRAAAAASFRATGSRDGFTQVTLEGWIWRGSLREERRDGHTLALSKPGEEKLRAEPNGTVVARLVSGALLDEVERRGGWVHVRRTGWIASAALSSAPQTSAHPPGRPAAPPGAAPAAAAQGAPAPAPAAQASPAQTPAETAASALQDLDPRLAVVRRRVELRRAPDAPPAGTLEAEMPVRITARAGEWVRVEMQGWVRESELRPAGSAALSNVTAAELRTDPDRFKGRLLRWTIQFIALQTADELRPDFTPGEQYILARGPAPEYAFAYIVVPADKAAAVAQIAPLASVTIIAKVRTGRSTYLANPILELVDIVP
ncbi:MAG: SH3 domain-containing protein [Gemmatimonadales bacterium]